MMNRSLRSSLIFAFAGAAALIAVFSFAALQSRADSETSGQWFISPHSKSADYNVTFRSSGSDGGHTWDFEDTNTVDRSAIRGMTDSQLNSGGLHVTFRIVRDAGWFACDGWAGSGRAEGRYVFTPDPAFAQALATRGISAPTERQSLRLAVSGIDLAYIDHLRAAGVSAISPDDLTRLADHGVDPAFLMGITADGYRFHSADDLVRLADHGVDPAYVSSLRTDGYTNLSVDDLVRLRDHGVDPAFIASMRDAGYPNLSAEDLIRLRDHGVDADFVKHLSAHGYSKLSVDDLIRLRDHGF
ncbi:MAG: hypothetical protein JO194_06825 [Candidatus Eremiobacteraeota bacterium]|nr:hypothetical protein [Candidatus Eremiobacteraeota bacterium]